MIKWRKCEVDLNIKDIMKVIDILPCSWADGYCDYDEDSGCYIPTPIADGNNLIYAVEDDSDGFVIMYYKCSADGTIVKVGIEEYDWQ